MKKLLISAFAMFASCSVFADEYSVQILPTKLEPNVSLADNIATTGGINVLEFYLHEGDNFNSNNIVNCQIFFYLPSDMQVQATVYDPDEDEDVTISKIEVGGRAFAASDKRVWGLNKVKTSEISGYNRWSITAYTNPSTVKLLRGKTSSTGTSYVDEYGDGCIVKLYVGTEGMAEGLYPVYVENVILGESATLGHYSTNRTASYITVGSASASTFPVTNSLPSFVTRSLPTSAITSLDMSAATTVYGDLNLSSFAITALPEAGVTVEGTTSYTRNLSTQYGTVCVPFELTSTEETQYYALSEMTGNKLTFQPVDVVAAGTPALVKGNISASVNNATLVAPVSGAMVGTYSNIKPGAVGYFIGENAFWALESTTKVGSYKAYIPGALGAKSLKIFIEDETGIHEVSSEISSDDIYNLQGMKLNKTQKGINIVGGKKVILK